VIYTKSKGQDGEIRFLNIDTNNIEGKTFYFEDKFYDLSQYLETGEMVEVKAK
jgi:hypothetical protein